MGKRDKGIRGTGTRNDGQAYGSAIVTASIGESGPTGTIAKLTPLLLGVKDAGAYVGVGRSLIYQAVKDGELDLVKIRGRSLLRVSDLNDWAGGRLVRP